MKIYSPLLSWQLNRNVMWQAAPHVSSANTMVGIGVQFQERNFIIPVFRTAATVPEICQVLILVVILVHPGIC